MTSFAADLLVLWLVLTAACSALLLVVMGVQDACARTRRKRTARARHRWTGGAAVRQGVSRGAGPVPPR